MRVLVVDDQELMRRGLTMLLSTEDDVDVVGEASEGREALALVPRTCPDVVLTDARMPIMDGVDLVASLARAHPGLPAVILTTFDDHDLVQRALAAGAAGFMLKDSSIADLVHAMRSALAGGLVIDPRQVEEELGIRTLPAEQPEGAFELPEGDGETYPEDTAEDIAEEPAEPQGEPTEPTDTPE